jgi:hypothetical protein
MEVDKIIVNYVEKPVINIIKEQMIVPVEIECPHIIKEVSPVYVTNIREDVK